MEANNLATCTYKCYLCEEIFHDDIQRATDHLKLHGIKDGNELKCMKAQSDELFCKVKCTTFKTLRRHMRQNKCKLYSGDVIQEEEDNCNLCSSSSDVSGGNQWSCLVDDFGALNFDKDLRKTEKEDFTSLASNFVNKLIIANVQHDIVNEIVEFAKGVASKITTMNRHEINSMKTIENIESILDSNEVFVTNCMNKFSTRFRRTKHYTSLPYFVSPKTISLGVADGYEYVSVLETLQKTFANKDFRDMYLNYNRNHECREGTYERYCCGKNYKESNFFQLNKNHIQIQIFFDDVQLTSPLKTKPHSMTAIYFIIRNLPAEYISKLDNMYLIALCDSIKFKKYGCNSIFERFVQEMKILETIGISINIKDDGGICEKVVFKGTLVQVSFDNLGGNLAFGIIPHFQADFCCRICMCAKKEYTKKTIELENKIRNKEHYVEQIEKIRQSPGVKLEPKATFGIVNYSVLNDLNFYHTIDNRSQDMMHDIYEGAMPFVLRLFFNRLIDRKITTQVEIQLKIESFDYGLTEKKNRPSKICFKKHNLNQNASQMKCLMLHMPFIFVDLLQLKDNNKRLSVHKVWTLIEHILKINQIISSSLIAENDLKDLENYTDVFLTKIKQMFKKDLIPKLHFMTHYANTIRAMGPLKYLQMMRGDAKHQPFTQYAKRSRNYINICKTLANRHQQVLAAKWNESTYKDSVVISKKRFKVFDSKNKKNKLAHEIQNYSEILLGYFKNIDQVAIIKFVVINSSTFTKGLYIFHSDKMYEINAVLKSSISFIFLCTQYNTVKFYKFSNSFEIQKSTETVLIRFEELKCKRTYEAKSLHDKPHIIADELDMLPIYSNLI